MAVSSGGTHQKRSWDHSHPPMKSSPFLLQVMSGIGFPLTEHLRWTSAPITDTWSWGGSVSHFGGSARRSVNTTGENTKVRSHQRTFHHHVKVVDDVSSRVLGLAHVLPSIAVLHFRQDQKTTEVVKFCPRRQLLSHFHPLDFWSGTTTRHMVILYCQTNYTTASGVKKSNLYIQSPRYTLQLQKLSSQHHLLGLDTRGQQHAGHSHWGGFRRWEGNKHHIIWSSNVFKFFRTLMDKWISSISSDSKSTFKLQPNTGGNAHHVTCRKMLLNPASQQLNKTPERDETGLQVCSAIYLNTLKEMAPKQSGFSGLDLRKNHFLIYR